MKGVPTGYVRNLSWPGLGCLGGDPGTKSPRTLKALLWVSLEEVKVTLGLLTAGALMPMLFKSQLRKKEDTQLQERAERRAYVFVPYL